ncbi:hypothetical protein C483_17083 [Natrialba hulunbeirensis JCM 10989]|uniref:Uncharacterized protein n=1 Tax=Natrialba hulunbeirensis JCM 10989 TaxID=1227493 RepID=L9ZMQ3_9EURY|nr:hypothetical protein [Natrialba hulunbeirensis]ELY87634.1 hypothetical protein C483_17083 [Natrialba hulunbeirensis JCM 10989]
MSDTDDSQDLQEQVTDLLETADAEAGALATATDTDSSTDTDTATATDTPSGSTMATLSETASDLLESAEPRDLLEAVGLGTLPDGSEPETIPAAIAQGDPEHVEDLERLLRLARVGESTDEEGLEDAVGGLHEAIREHRDTADDEPDSGGDATTADSDEGDTGAGAGERVGEDDSDGDSASDSDSDDDTESDSDSDSDSSTGDDVLEFVEDELGEALGDRVSSFSEDVEGLREKVSSVGGESEADADDENEGDDADAEAEADAADDDDGLLDEGLGADLEPDLGTDSDGGQTSRGVVRYSTLAPSPSKRADMRSPARFSTMPKKDE